MTHKRVSRQLVATISRSMLSECCGGLIYKLAQRRSLSEENYSMTLLNES